MAEICSATNCQLTIWWHFVAFRGISWQVKIVPNFGRIPANFRSRANSNLAGNSPGWQSSLAMFCGLATRLAHSLAPKHAVSAVPAREPEAAVDMHAKLTGRPIHHKATLGLMGFAGSCNGLLRVPSDNASRRDRASTANRCGTSGFAQPAFGLSGFLPNRSGLIPCNFAGCHVSMEIHRRHRGVSMLRRVRVEA